MSVCIWKNSSAIFYLSRDLGWAFTSLQYFYPKRNDAPILTIHHPPSATLTHSITWINHGLMCCSAIRTSRSAPLSGLFARVAFILARSQRPSFYLSTHQPRPSSVSMNEFPSLFPFPISFHSIPSLAWPRASLTCNFGTIHSLGWSVGSNNYSIPCILAPPPEPPYDGTTRHDTTRLRLGDLFVMPAFIIVIIHAWMDKYDDNDADYQLMLAQLVSYPARASILRYHELDHHLLSIHRRRTCLYLALKLDSRFCIIYPPHTSNEQTNDNASISPYDYQGPGSSPSPLPSPGLSGLPPPHSSHSHPSSHQHQHQHAHSSNASSPDSVPSNSHSPTTPITSPSTNANSNTNTNANTNTNDANNTFLHFSHSADVGSGGLTKQTYSAWVSVSGTGGGEGTQRKKWHMTVRCAALFWSGLFCFWWGVGLSFFRSFVLGALALAASMRCDVMGVSVLAFRFVAWWDVR